MALILGLESSCDETAAALVTSDRRVLAHRLAGQEAAHRPYGGVVPEIAARAHVDALIPLVEAALAAARAAGAESAFLEVAEGNAVALALYRGVGFAETGRRRAYYAHADRAAEDALVLRRDLHA